jgi:hypothetical protein
MATGMVIMMDYTVRIPSTTIAMIAIATFTTGIATLPPTEIKMEKMFSMLPLATNTML